MKLESECLLMVSLLLAGFTSELCFDFNSSTGTIERYFDYQNDNSSNPICPTDVVIPNKINGVNVIALADFSFAYCNYLTYNDTNQEDLVLLSSTVSENNLIYKLNKTFLYNEDNNVSNINSPLRCVSLTSVIIPNGVETIGDVAFRGNDISSVVIPNSVTSIGWDAFAGNNLTSIVIPNNVTNISEGAFSYNALTSVTIPSSITTFDGNPFGNNPNLTNIIVDSNNPEYMSSNNALYTKDGKTLISGTKTSSNSILSTTTTIGNSAFYGMGLTNVTIPTSVTSIGSYAFYYNNLTSVYIKGKSSSTGFASYGSGIWGWTTGYSDSNITWNAL